MTVKTTSIEIPLFCHTKRIMTGKGVFRMESNEKMDKLKHQLQQSKKEVEHLLQDHFDLLRSHTHDSTGELSSYDNHPADDATELYEREKDIALLEHSEQELKEIDYALQAMERGVYGKCEKCGKDIPFERLQAIPTTTFCVEHSPSQQTSHNRPIEEEVLMPPFGKFDFDNRKESVAFDSEDSWQEVASYGTSESPSDFARPPADYEDMYVESEENIGYVEDYENFAAVDITGKHRSIIPNTQHEKLESELEEEGIMTPYGDLPRNEKDPYVED